MDSTPQIIVPSAEDGPQLYTPFPWQTESHERFIQPYRDIEQRVFWKEILTLKEAMDEIHDQHKKQPINIWWEPRIGKTGIAIMLIQEVDEITRRIERFFGETVVGNPTLIVCPSHLTSHWTGTADKDSEVQHWTEWVPGVDTICIEGPKERRMSLLVQAAFLSPRLVVVPYSFFQFDIAKRRDELRLLMELTIRTVVLDEAHSISNPEAQTSRNIELLPHLDNCLIIMLTGTPVPNRIDKLHNPMAMAYPGPLKIETVGPHGGKHYVPISKIPWREVQDNAFNAKMRRDISPTMGSMDTFLEHYTQTDIYRGNKRVVSVANLNIETCRLCDWSRCKHVPNPVTGVSGPCPYLSVSSEERIPKYCNNCTNYLPLACRNCDQEIPPLYIKLQRLGVDRRTMAECRPGIKKMYDNILVDMTPSQKELYKQVKKGVVSWRDSLGGTRKVSQTVAIAVLNALRTVATDPEQWYLGWVARKGGSIPVEFFEGLKPPTDRRSGKVEWLKDFVANELGDVDKILIFSEWARTVHILADELKVLNPFAVTGAMSQKQFLQAKREFTDDPSRRAWISTAASIEGHDLSANGATKYVFMMNPSWSNRFALQASDRATNPNYDNVIRIWTLLSRKSIDARVQRRLAMKAREMDLAIDNGIGMVPVTFDANDIMEILDALDLE